MPSFRGIYISTLSPIVRIINRGLRGRENLGTLVCGSLTRPELTTLKVLGLLDVPTPRTVRRLPQAHPGSQPPQELNRLQELSSPWAALILLEAVNGVPLGMVLSRLSRVLRAPEVRAHPGTCISIHSRSKEPGPIPISWVYRGIVAHWDRVYAGYWI